MKNILVTGGSGKAGRLPGSGSGTSEPAGRGTFSAAALRCPVGRSLRPRPA